MRIELDHLFACTAPGVPEAEKLVQFVLHEGPPNQHPGQGTVNRRFSFANAMIELVWVGDAREAQSQNTRRTLLGKDGLLGNYRLSFRRLPAACRPSRHRTTLYRMEVSARIFGRSASYAYRRSGN